MSSAEPYFKSPVLTFSQKIQTKLPRFPGPITPHHSRIFWDSIALISWTGMHLYQLFMLSSHIWSVNVVHYRVSAPNITLDTIACLFSHKSTNYILPYFSIWGPYQWCSSRSALVLYGSHNWSPIIHKKKKQGGDLEEIQQVMVSIEIQSHERSLSVGYSMFLCVECGEVIDQLQLLETKAGFGRFILSADARASSPELTSLTPDFSMRNLEESRNLRFTGQPPSNVHVSCHRELVDICYERNRIREAGPARWPVKCQASMSITRGRSSIRNPRREKRAWNLPKIRRRQLQQT